MAIRPFLLLLLGSLITAAENPYQRRKSNQRLLQEGDESTELLLLKQKLLLLEDYGAENPYQRRKRNQRLLQEGDESTELLLLKQKLLEDYGAENPYQRRKSKQRLLQEGDESTELLLLKQKLLEDYRAENPYQRRKSNQRLLEEEEEESSERQLVKQTLLRDYDKSAFPFNDTKGLTVEVGLNFHRVVNVDVRNAVIDLIVWCRQAWEDPRLVVNDTNLQRVNFWVDQGSGSAGETSQIWTPDLELWNLEESLSTSMTDAYASLTPSTGRVFWSRPGHLKPVCKFEGLHNFPFDQLECTIEIGSWSYSGLYIRPKLMDGTGVSIGGSETAGESFAEFTLSDVWAEEFIYPPFDLAAPDEDWPVVLYHVTFRRAWSPYVRGYVVLQIVLNVASFCCFWLPPHIGERMSLAITSLLAAVASELVVAANLPSADTLTWFAKFSIVSMLFTALTLIESAAAIYFHYYTGDDLVPRWAAWMGRKLRQKLRQEASPGPTRDDIPNRKHDQEISDLSANPLSSQCDKNGFDEVVIDDGEDPTISLGLNGGDTNHQSDSDEVIDDEDYSPSQPTEHSRSMRRPTLEMRHSSRMRRTIKTILGRDADDFKNSQEMENNHRWQKVSAAMDEVSRVVFPATFAIFLTWVFGASNR